MASATDIITYVGIPLALLGVFPIFFNACVSIIKRRALNQACQKYGLHPQHMSANMVSGKVSVQFRNLSYNPAVFFEKAQAGIFEPGCTEKNSPPGGTWLPLKRALLEEDNEDGGNDAVAVTPRGPNALPRMEIRKCDFAIWLLSVGAQINREPRQRNQADLAADRGLPAALSVDNQWMVRTRDRQPSVEESVYLCGGCRYLAPDFARALTLFNGLSFQEMRRLFPNAPLPPPGTPEPRFAVLKVEAPHGQQLVHTDPERRQWLARMGDEAILRSYFPAGNMASEIWIAKVSLGDAVRVFFSSGHMKFLDSRKSLPILLACFLSIVAFLPDYLESFTRLEKWQHPAPRIDEQFIALVDVLAAKLEELNRAGWFMPTPGQAGNADRLMDAVARVADLAAPLLGYAQIEGIEMLPWAADPPALLRLYVHEISHQYAVDGKNISDAKALGRQFVEAGGLVMLLPSWVMSTDNLQLG